MTIVLDNNCLIQIIPKLAPYRWIYDDILSGKIRLIVSSEIINEYEEVINDFYESEMMGGNIARLILNLPGTIRKFPTYRFLLIAKDPDDDKYSDAAVIGNADYLVSNDRHFKVLNRIDFPKIICLRLDDFAVLWKQYKLENEV